MNERIKELVEQCRTLYRDGNGQYVEQFDEEKFAELIVKECIEQVRAVGDLRGANEDMIYGADIAAIRLSKHFGVE